jgi:hypothetical protein
VRNDPGVFQESTQASRLKEEKQSIRDATGNQYRGGKSLKFVPARIITKYIFQMWSFGDACLAPYPKDSVRLDSARIVGILDDASKLSCLVRFDKVPGKHDGVSVFVVGLSDLRWFVIFYY